MNRQFFKQFAIALALFLLGYFTFNSKLFAQDLIGKAARTEITQLAGIRS